jgi:hypothetical protein
MEEKSSLYNFAIIAQPFDYKNNYMWQRVGKYKRLTDAEKALSVFLSEKLATCYYKIVPYFDGYWFTCLESEKKAYYETVQLLWDYLREKGLSEDATIFIHNKKEKKKRWIFF